MTDFNIKKCLDPNKRVKYTTGLVMGVDEFEQEQLYFIEKNRLNNRGLHGYGTVCGLKVEIDKENAEIVVSPGIAINPKGQEICVLSAQCANLKKWSEDYHTQIKERFEELTKQRNGTPPDTISIDIMLCYRECETDNVAVCSIPCGSQEDNIIPSRIADDFELSLCLPGLNEETSRKNETDKLNNCNKVSQLPHISEEDAVRRFGKLLGRIVIADDQPGLEQKEMEELVRNLKTDQDTSCSDLNLYPDTVLDILRAAFRVWVTEVLPGPICEDDNCSICIKDEPYSCVRLSTLEVPFEKIGDSIKLKELKDDDDVKIIEDDRSLLLNSRVLQELLLYHMSGKTAETNSNLKQYKGNCMFTAIPCEGWEAVFDRIDDGQDTSICFQAGIYELDKPIVIKNKGHIKISGCGAGTKFINPESEIVFKFELCKSVVVEDIYAQSGVTGSGKNEKFSNLNGTLTFCTCPEVTVERVGLKCAAGAERAGTCINVRDAVEYNRHTITKVNPVESVHIHNCNLEIGDQQGGILLVNVLRAHVEDNLLRGHSTRDSLPVRLQNKKYRSAIRKLMINSSHLGQPENDDVLLSSDIVGIKAGKGFVWFKTDDLLVSAWNEWIDKTPPKGVQNDRDLLFHLKKVADRVLLNEGVLKVGETESGLFKKWYDDLFFYPAAGSQGIVIAGSMIDEVHIINNKISGFLQGIHVGTSHRGVTSSTGDKAGIVHITGNTIGVLLQPSGTRERHGIFVGNCDSLIVQNNYVFVNRVFLKNSLEIDAIRIYGHPGRMMIVRQNHMVNAGTGVCFVPLSGGSGNPQWVITDNMTEKCKFQVQVEEKIAGIRQKVRGIEFNFS